jgi:HAD superfamily hydrolase (TIGR01662 family)
VRCVLLETTAAQCRFNAARRMIATHGDLLDAAAIAQAGKRDPNTFPPVVIDRWFARFEPPTVAEGFAEVVRVPYVRRLGRAYTHKAVFLDYDGTLRTTRGKVPFPRKPEDVVLLPRRRKVLQRWVDAGYRLLGLSNQAGVALGQISEEAARACIAHTNALLGLEIDAEIATAGPGQPAEYGRKPMPGYAVWFIEKYQLDPAQCVMVGDREPDRLFAEGAGLRFFWAKDFFKGDAGPELLTEAPQAAQGIPPANKKPITAP